MQSKEIPSIPEIEQEPSSRINLSFLRHGEKEPGKGDVSITEKGKQQAKEAGLRFRKEPDVARTVGFGSPRIRTQETAAWLMSAGRDDITGNESVEELKAKLDEGLMIGKKIGIEPKLDAIVTGGEGQAALREGRYLRFLIEDRPKNFSRNAARIAEIVKKYYQVAPRWDRIVQKETDEDKRTLERILVTHQGLSEAFLAKLIEKTKGEDERKRFVEALDNQGFNETEGFQVEIDNIPGKEPQIRIRYKREENGKIRFEFDENVPPKMINQIIEEGEKFYLEVEGDETK
jgi:broad specificity phosphatase PhoE